MIVIATMDSEFMKPVQNSDDEEETDSLLLQSNLEYSNSIYASASVFNNIRLRMSRRTISTKEIKETCLTAACNHDER